MSELPGPACLVIRILWPDELVDSALEDIGEAYRRDLSRRGHSYAARRLWREILCTNWVALRMEARAVRVGTDRRRGIAVVVDAARADLRYGARSLARSPTFSLLALFTLAVGIGAVTAIFSVVDGVLLKPLGFRSPEQLVFVWDEFVWIGVPRGSVTGPQVADLREQATLFEEFVAIQGVTAQMTGAGEPEELRAGAATDNFFRTLGVDAALGRTFGSGDGTPGAPPVAVISHGFWQRRFGSDPAIIGQSVTINDLPTTVVGVLPAEFSFAIPGGSPSGGGAEVWLPVQRDLASGSRGEHEYMVLARIRDGVSFRHAMDELAALGRRQDEDWFGKNGFAFTAARVSDELVSHTREALVLLLGAVGILLLIAVVNIATLMLIRAQNRVREVGVRAALGASRARITGGAFLESFLLAAGGGVLGLVGARAGVQSLIRWAPELLPRRGDITVDGAALAFAGVAVLLTALVCGVAPAAHCARLDATAVLRGYGRSHRGRAGRARSVLVVGQVAAAVVLLVAAGLLVRSFVKVMSVDPGFESRDLVAVDLRLPQSRYEDFEARTAFVEEFLTRARAMPGVRSAAAAAAVPMAPSGIGQTDSRPDIQGEADERIFVDYVQVTPGYFETMGMTLTAGRVIRETDRADAPRVVVIDDRLARYWPNDDAVGRTISIFGQEWTVVGVIHHPRLQSIYADGRPQLYVPYARFSSRLLTFVVRTEVAMDVLLPILRAAVTEIDPSQPVFNVRTMEGVVKASTYDRRFATILMAAFAVSGLLLAMLGVYGVLAHGVASRRRELGIRVALGAGSGNLRALVVRQALLLAGTGIALGMLGALWITRVMAAAVYQVSRLDPVTFIAVPLLIVAVAGLAALVPAWRAGAAEPLEVIRSE